MVLANRSNKNHQCFPSLTSISSDTGLNRVTVTRCITQLLELGLIGRAKRGIDSNLYTLLVVAPRNQRQRQGAPTDRRSVVAPRSAGSSTMQPSVVAPRSMEPPIEPKVNPKGDIPPTKKGRPKTDPPATIEITNKLREWAKDEGVTSNLQLETRKMLDHFKGKGEKKVDWEATWRNWMRNSMVYNRNGGNGNGNRANRQDQNAEGAREVWAALHPEDSVSDERGSPRNVTSDLFGTPVKS